MKRSFVAAALIAAVLVAAAFVAAPAPGVTPRRVVCIDPGHGGPYSNENANGLAEKAVNLAISLSLRTELQRRGYAVIMTRSTDRAVQLRDIPTWNYSSRTGSWTFAKDYLLGNVPIPKDDLQARVDLSNSLTADLFVCIHNNGSSNRSVRGLETYYSLRDAEGRRLAPYVQSGILARTHEPNRGVRTADFYVLRFSNAPAVLVECAYISNPTDARLLKQYWFRNRIAVGIADGISRYFAAGSGAKLYPRITGGDAVSVAAAASRALNPTSAATVLLASADAPSPAVPAPALAARLRAPLLFSAADAVPTATATELVRLKPSRVIVLGTESEVSSGVVSAVASDVPGAAIDRVDAHTASAASLAIAHEFAGARGYALASGTSTADALAAAAWAARYSGPVLLGPAGRGAVASAAATLGAGVYARLAVNCSIPATPAVARSVTAKGADAYWTDRAVMLLLGGSFSPVVATSNDDASAIVAATVAARRNQPLLFTRRAMLPPSARYWITSMRPRIGGYTIVDGETTPTPVLLDRELAKSSWW